MLNIDNMSMEELGELLGYPKCCINYFCSNAGFSSSWYIYTQTNPFSGTGFISCPECSQKPEATKEYINTNRHPDLPVFPNFN